MKPRMMTRHFVGVFCILLIGSCAVTQDSEFFGAAGRMGQMLVNGIALFPELQLVAAVEFDGHACIGQDAGLVAGSKATGVSLTGDAGGAVAVADVAVDFALHAAVPGHVQAADAAGTAMVIGTTGLDEEETEVVSEAAGRIPIVWAPNMSLAMNVLFALTKRAAGILGTAYDAEIVETHHRHKKDAPSGTALHLGECVAAGRGQQQAEQMVEQGQQQLQNLQQQAGQQVERLKGAADQAQQFLNEAPGQAMQAATDAAQQAAGEARASGCYHS